MSFDIDQDEAEQCYRERAALLDALRAMVAAQHAGPITQEMYDAWEVARALVEALAKERMPPAAMKGWRLVPEEPTTEMIDAAFVWNLDREKLRAAIQAAPEPPIARRPLPNVPRP